MACIVAFAAVDLPGPGLSHSIVANDYSGRPLSVFDIRVEIDSGATGAFEREAIDDDVSLRLPVRGRVPSM